MQNTMCSGRTHGELFRILAFASALFALATVQFARAHDGGAHGAELGNVHFEVACNATAQSEFNVAMAYYHSFQWQRAIATSDRVLQADPTCGMAHWVKASRDARQPICLADHSVRESND